MHNCTLNMSYISLCVKKIPDKIDNRQYRLDKNTMVFWSVELILGDFRRKF